MLVDYCTVFIVDLLEFLYCGFKVLVNLLSCLRLKMCLGYFIDLLFGCVFR